MISWAAFRAGSPTGASLSAQALTDTNSSAGLELLYLIEGRPLGNLESYTGLQFTDSPTQISGGFAFRLKHRSILARIFAIRGLSSSQSIRHSSVGIQLGYEYAFHEHWSASFLSGFRLENGMVSRYVDTVGMVAPGLVPNVLRWDYQLHYLQNQLNITYWFGQSPLAFLMPKAISLSLNYGFAVSPSQILFDTPSRTMIPSPAEKAFDNIWQVGLKMEWRLTQ